MAPSPVVIDGTTTSLSESGPPAQQNIIVPTPSLPAFPPPFANDDNGGTSPPEQQEEDEKGSKAGHNYTNSRTSVVEDATFAGPSIYSNKKGNYSSGKSSLLSSNPLTAIREGLDKATLSNSPPPSSLPGTLPTPVPTNIPIHAPTRKPRKPTSAAIASWNTRYAELQAFHAQFGHCDVPQLYQPNKALGKWVSKQREHYRALIQQKSSPLLPERIEKLHQLNFKFVIGKGQHASIHGVFHSPKLVDVWEEKFEELKKYKELHGHADVPSVKGAGGDKETNSLARWVTKQRAKKKMLQEGKINSSTILNDRIKRLTEIGFKFHIGTGNFDHKAHTYRWQEQWDEKYANLLEYKAEHGTTDVPQAYPRLGPWVGKQRELYKAKKSGAEETTLTDDRIAKLEEIGFHWSVSDSFFENYLNDLKKYKKKHGHTNVLHHEDKRLYNFLLRQRQAFVDFMEGCDDTKMSHTRVRQLEELGIDWKYALYKGKRNKKEAAITPKDKKNESNHPLVRSSSEATGGENEESRNEMDGKTDSQEAGNSSKVETSDTGKSGTQLKSKTGNSSDSIEKNNASHNPQTESSIHDQTQNYDENEDDKNSDTFVLPSAKKNLSSQLPVPNNCNRPHNQSEVESKGDQGDSSGATEKDATSGPASQTASKQTEADDKEDEDNARSVNAGPYISHDEICLDGPASKTTSSTQSEKVNDDEMHKKQAVNYATALLQGSQASSLISNHQQKSGRSQKKTKGLSKSKLKANWPYKKFLTKPDVWMKKYEQMVEYQKKHGSCKIPSRDKENPALGSWCKLQREDYKHRQEGKPSPMCDERIELLEAIGFEWRLVKFQKPATWEERFQELKKYHAEYGHVDVPQSYAKIAGLGKWVSKQRDFYRHLQEGKPSRLTSDQVMKLEDIGFKFFIGKGQRTKSWDDYYNDLLEFKASKGHTNIPRGYRDNTALGWWAGRQRDAYKRAQIGSRIGKTAQARLSMLQDIGFSFHFGEPVEKADKNATVDSKKDNKNDTDKTESEKTNTKPNRGRPKTNKEGGPKGSTNSDDNKTGVKRKKVAKVPKAVNKDNIENHGITSKNEDGASSNRTKNTAEKADINPIPIGKSDNAEEKKRKKSSTSGKIKRGNAQNSDEQIRRNPHQKIAESESSDIII